MTCQALSEEDASEKGDPEIDLLQLDLQVTQADIIIAWFFELVWVLKFLDNIFVDNEV